MKNKIENFEQKLKKALGKKKYNKLSKKEREIIKEMNKCQQEGGAIGTATSGALPKK